MDKLAFLALITLITFTGCDPKTNQQVPGSANEELVRNYFSRFNQHQWQEMAEMYADTAEFKDPSLGRGIVKQTRQQTINKYTELNRIFHNLHDEVIKVYPAGAKHVIVEFVSSGTSSDGTTFELPICTIFTVEAGKITQDFTYYDNFEDPVASPDK